MRTNFLLFLLTTLIHQSLSQDETICDGNYGQLIPDPDRCYAYINCVLSVPHNYECPIGEIFVANQRECRPGNRETCEVHILNEICRYVFFGARPYPGDEKLYVGCVMNEGILMECYENEIFNSDINECVEGQITSTTVSSTTSTSSSIPITTTSTLTTNTSLPTTNSSDSTTSVFIPTETTETTSTSTSSTWTETTTTPTTLPTTTTFPQNVTTTPVETTTTSFNPCRGLPNGTFLPHETDCSKAYICMNNQPEMIICDPGNIFSFVDEDCVPGSC